MGKIKNIGLLISLLLFLYLLNPYSINFLFGYLLVVIVISKKTFLLKNVDKNFLLLLVFSFTYAMFYAFKPSGGFQYVFVYALFPSSFYLLGKYIFIKLEQDSSSIYYFLFLLGAVYSLTPLISVLLNIAEGGFGQIDRSLPLFWDGRILTATIMGSFFAFNMCIPALLIVKKSGRNIFFTAGAVLVFLLSLACVLRIGSRTQLAVFLITLLCSLVYIMPRQSIRRNLVIFALFFGTLSYIISNVSFDLDQDWLSTFASRMENNGEGDIASGGGRTQRWVKSFENLFAKPLGWDEKEFGHSHNMWLDVLRVAGVIPFFLLLLFTLNSFIQIKSALSQVKTNYAFNSQLLIYGLAFFLVFMVEPVFEGLFTLFAIFCLFMGIVNKYRTMQP
ncbi:MAG: hypothetical protein ABJN95_09960 [Maribacter sp.]|uniref:hypothetical protein n=1 Tax=Maribacter sp. TaxID=1897614 RepID=UPI0032974787